MLIQEKIVVALVILAALIFLWRHFTAASRKSDSGCGGCGCGKPLNISKPGDQKNRRP
jgi:hypothetical protein